ncbi:MAG TPA: hypothetical protein VHT30_02020 [Acidimicrobiales bacterium]|jgi:hypothetical protein|nr:hypothetical protein [Acidimicrobiales bacterium]
MRLRLGLVAGFAAGVYVATVAHKRTQQLNQNVNQRLNRTVGQSALDAAADKAKAALSLGIERAKDVVSAKLADQNPVRSVVEAPSRLAAQERNGQTISPGS